MSETLLLDLLGNVCLSGTGSPVWFLHWLMTRRLHPIDEFQYHYHLHHHHHHHLCHHHHHHHNRYRMKPHWHISYLSLFVIIFVLFNSICQLNSETPPTAIFTTVSSIPSSPIILCDHPKVVLIPNFLTEKEADTLIDVSLPFFLPGLTAGHRQSDARTSSATFLPTLLRRNSTISLIEKRLESLTHIPLSQSEPLQVQRYNTGEMYDLHSDASHKPGETGRVVTIVMYLSNVDNGGETLFPYVHKNPVADIDTTQAPYFGNIKAQQCHVKESDVARSKHLPFCACKNRLKVKPNKGSLLLFFPSLERHGADITTVHGSCPVDGARPKYVSQKWFRNEAFTLIDDRNCAGHWINFIITDTDLSLNNKYIKNNHILSIPDLSLNGWRLNVTSALTLVSGIAEFRRDEVGYIGLYMSRNKSDEPETMGMGLAIAGGSSHGLVSFTLLRYRPTLTLSMFIQLEEDVAVSQLLSIQRHSTNSMGYPSRSLVCRDRRSSNTTQYVANDSIISLGLSSDRNPTWTLFNVVNDTHICPDVRSTFSSGKHHSKSGVKGIFPLHRLIHIALTLDCDLVDNAVLEKDRKYNDVTRDWINCHIHTFINGYKSQSALNIRKMAITLPSKEDKWHVVIGPLSNVIVSDVSVYSRVLSSFEIPMLRRNDYMFPTGLPLANPKWREKVQTLKDK